MSIAEGIKGKRRKPYVVNHRRVLFEKAFDELIAGTTCPSYVHYRANKLKEVQR